MGILKSAVTVAAAALLAAGASAAEKRADLPTELADIFAGPLPGAAVAVIEDGEVSLLQAYGASDIATNTPATPDTVFRSGSVSKSVVGVVVMMLVEEGKLSLDDRLANLAPEIPFNNPWEDEEPIRLKHLLEHTTGWADLSPKEFALNDPGMSLLDGILVGGARKSRYRPGLYHAYTSAGYGIAGYIVEKVEGKPFCDVARERVFEPLGMTSASYDEVDGIAKSYLPDGTETPYSHYPLYPAGGLNLNVGDLAKFTLFMINEGKVGDRGLLRPESIARIERSETTFAALAGLADGYGLGNAAYVGEKAVFRGHGGTIDGFNAEYRYLRSCRCGFAILANQDPIPRAAITTLERHLTEAMPEPKVGDVLSPELREFSGTYQPIAQRNRLTPLVDSLTVFRKVGISADGRVSVDGVVRMADAGGRLQRQDRAAPTLVFATSDEGTLLLSPTDSYRRVSARSVQMKFAAGVLYAAVFGVSVFIFVAALFRARLSKAHAASVIAFLPMAGTLGLLVYAAGLPPPTSIAVFGAPTSVSIGVFVMTLLVPLAGIASLVAAFSRGRGGMVGRAAAFSAGLLALGAAAYMAKFGWLGLMTWAI